MSNLTFGRQTNDDRRAAFSGAPASVDLAHDDYDTEQLDEAYAEAERWANDLHRAAHAEPEAIDVNDPYGLRDGSPESDDALLTIWDEESR